jgi:hypothetical protein
MQQFWLNVILDLELGRVLSKKDLRQPGVYWRGLWQFQRYILKNHLIRGMTVTGGQTTFILWESASTGRELSWTSV